MNRDQAREILEAAEAGSRNITEAQVTEALRVAETDPELRRQWGAPGAFEAAMIAGANSIPVPAGLKDAILADRKLVRPHFWQDWRTASAAAAAIVLFAAGSVWMVARSSESFAEFRREVILDQGSLYARPDFASADVTRVRAWLAKRGAPSEFTIPAGLRGWYVLGASVVEHEGRMVSMVSLADGQRRLGLFVFQHPAFADSPPEGIPDFEKCGVWKTASWRQGDTTYVLSGMKYPVFVSKFRKAGRWTISDRGDGAVTPVMGTESAG